MRLCHESGVPFVARGQGTGLSGGAMPHPDGVLIVLTRMNRICEIDLPNRCITVEPGIMNLDVSKAVASDGYYYAPDPSSQVICSIGGNLAENSGGAHCLKYGFTVHHVLGVDAVLPDGEIVHLGGPARDAPGLDILGVLVGSEGTLAVVTKVTLNLLRKPAAVKTLLAAFDSTGAAGNAVSGIIGAGIIPAAIEMMDRLTIEAAEEAVHPNFPKTEAVLIVELDGAEADVAALFVHVEKIQRDPGGQDRRAAGEILARAEGSFCCDGPSVTELLRPRWRDSEDETSRSVKSDCVTGQEVRTENRKCVSCRRWQPSSAHLL